MSDIDKAMQTMAENLKKNTGKSLEEWISFVNSKNFNKHGDMMKFLKDEMGLTHGYANLVAHRSKGSDAASNSEADLIVAQYKGKESLKPIHDRLIDEMKTFGGDIEASPKKAYVSMRRSKQFAMLMPATKTRFELHLNLKGVPGQGVLKENSQANAMCSHRIDLATLEDINSEVLGWLKEAYTRA